MNTAAGSARSSRSVFDRRGRACTCTTLETRVCDRLTPSVGKNGCNTPIGRYVCLSRPPFPHLTRCYRPAKANMPVLVRFSSVPSTSIHVAYNYGLRTAKSSSKAATSNTHATSSTVRSLSCHASTSFGTSTSTSKSSCKMSPARVRCSSGGCSGNQTTRRGRRTSRWSSGTRSSIARVRFMSAGWQSGRNQGFG